MKKKTRTVNANKFLVKKFAKNIYTFPFKAVDDTPGGGNLGRMHWNFEFHKGRKRKRNRSYYIEKILVWTGQTRDERYGNTFEIPCFTEMISGFRNSSDGRENALKFTNCLSYCEEHKVLVVEISPMNHHKELVIEVGNSIMIDIYFNC